MKEIADQIPSHAARSQKVNEAYSAGDVPIHLAASALNVPLSRILIGSARRNEREADARRRSIIPIRFGGRTLVDLDQIRRPAFDLTSLLLLTDLNLLNAVVGSFDQILVPPTTMEALANEQRRIRFHQPSLVEEAKKIVRLLRGDGLRVWREPTAPSKELVQEVGGDLAELLEAARARGGRVIRPVPIHKLGTFMEGIADLGSYESVIATTKQLALALADGGIIDRSAYEKAEEYLSRVDRGASLGPDIADVDIVYLDDLAVTYLQSAGILEPLAHSDRAVFVHPATEARVGELIELEEDQTTVLEVLKQVRIGLRDGLSTGKVALLPLRRHDDEDEARSIATEAPTLASLFEELGDCDAVCVDDRLVGKHPYITDKSGKSVLLFGFFDLIHRLEAQARLSREDRFSVVHVLRKRGFALIPIALDELEARLDPAQVESTGIDLRETAELRILRQATARLRSLTVLRQPGETAYLDQTRLACVIAIRRVWTSDRNSDALARAKSEWVYRHLMPPPLDWAHTIVDATQVMSPEAATALHLSLLLAPIGGNREKAYAEWVDKSVLAPMLPVYSDIVHAAARRATENIGAWAEEWTRDTT